MKIAKNYSYRESPSPLDFRDWTFSPVQWVWNLIKTSHSYEPEKEVEWCAKKIWSISMSDIKNIMQETTRIQKFIERARSLIVLSELCKWNGKDNITSEWLFFSPAENLWYSDQCASMVVWYVFKIDDHWRTFVISPLAPVDPENREPSWILQAKCPLAD